jgi:hypothetical protein
MCPSTPPQRRNPRLAKANGTWGVDLEVKEISLAIDTPDGPGECLLFGENVLQNYFERRKAQH